MTNDLIIRKINNIDIYDLEEEQIFELKDTIVKNVNLKQLRESVNKAVLNLSGVGDPTWNADLNFIALDKIFNIILSILSRSNNITFSSISVSNITSIFLVLANSTIDSHILSTKKIKS